MAAADVAVIGGGHNGLVAALVLAREGLGVVVIEANHELGGCVWSETLASGHRLERGAVDHGGMVAMAEALGLASFGLEYRRRETAVGACFGDGHTILFGVGSSRITEALSGTGDIDGYLALSRLGRALFSLVDGFETPPGLTTVASSLRLLPDGDRLMRILTSSADAVLDEYLTDEHLKGAVAMYGSHSQIPSFMPGSGMFALLLPASVDSPAARPVGGGAALIEALRRALEAAGSEILVGSPVVSVEDAGPRRRLVLEDGQVVEAVRVISTIDVKRTARLFAPTPPALADSARRVRDGALNVGELKVDVALASRPSFGPLDSAPDALWLLGERPDSLRRAYGEILAGHLPTSPALMWAAPSETDPTAAPAGKATAWLSAFVPLRPASGKWTPHLEEQAAEHLLSGFAAITGTDLRDHAENVTITGPTAWGKRLGSVTGNPNHLDLALDQLLGWRPPGMAGYRTPLGWLYLSGAGTHPGGGLTGAPGRNAALALLADLGRRRGPRGRAGRLRSLRAGIDLVRALRR